ncbi:hypothetical protein TSOC_006919 [Tetrabaena socialis]|uniref:Uncharacterized protein n=1 Tax=Tetrabaena socialis TaxID=47790 RepID=A0A2J8A2E2_9CHLO|nr:hypothetical protein TSOC_006919 [Tetrabaena socialis]|eukprot:PNH06682.1 hypothetical protein TSOC_006919 [Tetrabaena socialis]
MRHLRELRDYHEQLPRLPWVLQHAQPQHQPQHQLQSRQQPMAAAGSPAALAADGGGAAAPPPQQQPGPEPTPFLRGQLAEHVEEAGLAGYRASRGRPQPPRRYFAERAKAWRVRVLTERGLYSADAMRQHADAIRPKVYRRRVGIRD